MKILHISTSDSLGGAAIAAIRLHRAMLANGLDSTFLCLNRTVNDDGRIVTVGGLTRLKSKSIGIFSQIAFQKLFISDATKATKGLFSSMKTGCKVGNFVNIAEYDAIYIHWVTGGFLSLRGLEEILGTGKKVFWFMHDMFPITGGCHHSFDCDGYRQACGECPYLKKKGRRDFSWRQLKAKRGILDRYQNLSFIAPSRWLYQCALASPLAEKHGVYRIPNLLDEDIFRPLEKSFCRKALNLPTEKKIILFGAQSALVNPYKGFAYLKKALESLKKCGSVDEEEILVVIFGSSYSSTISNSLPFESRFLGVLHDDYALSLVYNSADVFCIPSLAENFPNTVLESSSCHTPIVGFDVGGIPDIVGSGTGYLSRYRDSDDFARGISYVLGGQARFSFRRADEFKAKNIIIRHMGILEAFPHGGSTS